MKEMHGNLWEGYPLPDTLYVVTTNGELNSSDWAIMGVGIARMAAQRQPRLPQYLGAMIKAFGNRSFLLPWQMASLPTKRHWKDRAHLDLISESLWTLRELLQIYGITDQIYMPRPGCGAGKLNWSEVEPLVKEAFDGHDGLYVWDW